MKASAPIFLIIMLAFAILLKKNDRKSINNILYNLKSPVVNNENDKKIK